MAFEPSSSRQPAASERGIDLISADSPGSFIDDTPTAKLVRQVLGAISEFDKAMTVAKLRGARERKRRDTGKCEGRKSHAELNPELVALVRQLRRRRPKGGQRSLREISAELAAQGFLNENGRPFAAASIASMLAHPNGPWATPAPVEHTRRKQIDRPI